MSYPNLFRAYYVKTHDGQTFDQILENSPGQVPTEQTYRNFVLLWLTPDRVPVLENDAIGAIRQGLSFNLNNTINQDIIEQIFEGSPVSSVVLEDFAKYPMRNAFGYPPWELLQGYIRAPDPDSYFISITGEYPENFLNRTEQLFYLTRGYGRPNPKISETDLQLREFYREASPTALIALSDLLGICPTRQDPIRVRENLSNCELGGIDRFHSTFVDRITECLDQVKLCSSESVCDPNRMEVCAPSEAVGLETCSPDRVNCFRKFLETHGILPIFEYDPHFNVFISNISQLDLYRKVIPEKIWNPNEVHGMAPIYVESILSMLPDTELIKITPAGNSLKERLRETLMANAMSHLLTPKWILDRDKVIYGREIDDKEKYSYEDMVQSFKDNNALIDPLGNVLDYQSAGNFKDPQINQFIYRTQAYELENRKRVAGLPRGQKDIPGELILWDRWSYPDRWIPVARRLSDQPIPADLLETTLEYYQEIFPR